MTELNHTFNKGLAVAECLQKYRQLNLAELIEQTGLSKQALLRVTATLVSRGWVRKRLNDKRYLWLGVSGQAERDAAELLATAARDELLALAERTGCAVDLALLNPQHQLYIADSTRSLANRGVNLYVAGYQPSLVMTALGRAYLLNCERPQIDAALNRITHFGDIAERYFLFTKRWQEEMSLCCERGYSLRFREDYIPQLLPESNPSLAIAIALVSKGRAIGAINLVWDDANRSIEDVMEQHFADLQHSAARIAALQCDLSM
ncbi:MAG: helix-turn-helix domain-containing protein [Pseudomonadales bacterium]